ncbi:Retrovirus-related Pol polyprotein from transposon TNT 1-94 [Apostasia shenzhenica]|uniref:Retrovirus-related Pol polyprotein from transposon TNT 1-94 n=1 Tax=Apostasia shenzhenica TaxID=1088818 RepID=A0A2I0APW8_9ASPA|nr:Retrovirus-related Pol polyprotein from transposon TNT 1-94 [Apostasia shenzhenica]
MIASFLYYHYFSCLSGTIYLANYTSDDSNFLLCIISQHLVSEPGFCIICHSDTADIPVTKFEVEKFDHKKDFGIWQLRVKAILVQNDLHHALLERKNARKMTDEEWKELDLKALSTIQLCLADEVLYNISDVETSVDLWRKLEKFYMSKSLTNKLYMKRQLYNLRMSEGANLLEHMNVFSKMISQFHSIEVKLQEKDVILLFLSLLPKSYNHLIITILYGKDTLKVEEVNATLLSNEVRNKQSTDESLI